MATSAFKSTTKRVPVGNSSPSTDDSPASSNSRAHRRSRSLSRFSRPIPVEIENEPGVVLPTPRRKFVNTVRGSDFAEISLDDLAIEFFSAKDNSDESVMSEIRPPMTPVGRRSRSVSRHGNGVTSSGIGVNGGGGGVKVSDSYGRRGRSVSRRNDGNVNGNGSVFNSGDGNSRIVSNGDLRRRRSVSVARHHISDSESDIDHSWSSAAQSNSRSNSRVASFQRLTASSHRRLTRSMSQAPQLRSHDGYSSSALTDDDLRDGRYGRKGIEKTIRAVYAQKKRSNDRNRVSKRLSEDAEKYLEDFISNFEDTDFSSFDEERSDATSSSLVRTTRQGDGALPNQNDNSLSVEMEGINLPWLKWDDNDAVPSTSLDTMQPPTTPNRKLWYPSQDLELILEHGNKSSSSHGSWNPEHTTANSTNARSSKLKEIKSPRFDVNKYLELEKSEDLIFDSWRERSVIKYGGLLLCGVVAPLKSILQF